MTLKAVGRRRTLCLLLAASLVAACQIRFISPYDAVLDTGLQEVRTSVNLVVTDASAKAGKAEGTYEQFESRYRELDARMGTLIARAKTDEVADLNCGLKASYLEKLKLQAPALAAQMSAVPPGATESKGCMTRLLELVQKQFSTLQQLHSQPALCAEPNKPELTCIRPAAAVNALSATNQTIDAALVVLSAKRKGETE